MHVPVRRFTDRVPLFGRLAALAAGTVHSSTAAAYQAMTPDGIAYLDIADAYVQGDLSAAINAVWSPLYSWLLGPLIVAMPRSVHWEFPLVHLVNFAIYVAALAAFEFFWTHVVRFARAMTADEQRAEHTTFPEWAWKFLGYTLFIWVSIDLISLASADAGSADVGVGLFGCGLSATRAPRVQGRPGASRCSASCSDSPIWRSPRRFPLAFAILAVAASPLRRPYLIASRGIVALSVFLVTSGPFIILISQAKGRMTFGESGRLTLREASTERGAVSAPARKIRNTAARSPIRLAGFSIRPPIYEFGYPWRPAAIRSDMTPRIGMRVSCPCFESAVQRGALLTNLAFYLLTVSPQPGRTGGDHVCLLRNWSRTSSRCVLDLLRRWGLACVAMVALALDPLVLVEGACQDRGCFSAPLAGDFFSPKRPSLPKALDHGGPRQHSSSQG